ncbi:hypothetical protein NA56DRAFT_709688 [Hyaloscypha hepaticicola]|uniref:Uncharacterized protein n=1 Tax=Hyaloscypha hepaticicola TaxID=2082293 RepID=A0A2J6PNT9_9HELO|nr:hypothetical protein NA56DRAFT_709688 [Hyaloscypha hepaticicola]
MSRAEKTIQCSGSALACDIPTPAREFPSVFHFANYHSSLSSPYLNFHSMSIFKQSIEFLPHEGRPYLVGRWVLGTTFHFEFYDSVGVPTEPALRGKFYGDF